MTNKTWITLSTHELFQRHSFACAQYKDRFILFAGGYNIRRQALTSALIFDVHSQTYAPLPDLPFTRGCCVGACLGDYFYVVHCDYIYRLSLSTRAAWELIHSHEIQGCAVMAYLSNVHSHYIRGYVRDVLSDEKHLYIFTNELFILYDPLSNKCTIMPQMPTQRYGYASTIIGDDIYIIGGSMGYGRKERYSSSVEVFSITKQSWKTVPSLPTPLAKAAATVTGRWIVVTGGYSDKITLSNQTFIFDTSNQYWEQKNIALTPPRGFHTCLTIGGYQIVSVGGIDSKRKNQSMVAIPRKHLISNWDIIKHFILMRYLVGQGRAYLMSVVKKIKYDEKTNPEKVLVKLMTDMSLDIFGEILSYFI